MRNIKKYRIVSVCFFFFNYKSAAFIVFPSRLPQIHRKDKKVNKYA